MLAERLQRYMIPIDIMQAGAGFRRDTVIGEYEDSLSV
jgi:hypothetical protein